MSTKKKIRLFRNKTRKRKGNRKQQLIRKVIKKTHTRKNKNKNKTKNKTKNKNKKIYTKKEYESGDGMLTSVWGPSLWHYLHTMSFNYPMNPTISDKNKYRKFIELLEFVLPCKYCRMNLKNNFKILPLTKSVMKNRNTFSKYIYDLHEHVNKMLGKKSGLSYNDIRERYEHFRSRCTIDNEKISIKQMKMLRKNKNKNKTNKKTKITERGCTEPLFGKKSKCVIRIVPQDTKCETFEMDKKCIKKRK